MTSFRSISMPAGFRCHFVGKKLSEMFLTVISFKYRRSVNDPSETVLYQLRFNII